VPTRPTRRPGHGGGTGPIRPPRGPRRHRRVGSAPSRRSTRATGRRGSRRRGRVQRPTAAWADGSPTPDIGVLTHNPCHNPDRRNLARTELPEKTASGGIPVPAEIPPEGGRPLPADRSSRGDRADRRSPCRPVVAMGQPPRLRLEQFYCTIGHRASAIAILVSIRGISPYRYGAPGVNVP